MLCKAMRERFEGVGNVKTSFSLVSAASIGDSKYMRDFET